MKGHVVATARWQRLDQPGHDTCRLARELDGWMLLGHAHFGTGGDETRLNYVVRCDEGWQALGADVTGVRGGQKVACRITPAGGCWALDDVAVPETEGCVDIDLAFTPATNLLPLRRLDLSGGGVASPAAWLRWPEGDLQRLDQSYHRLDETHVAYATPGFQADLTVSPYGFVTLYPDGWEGAVDED